MVRLARRRTARSIDQIDNVIAQIKRTRTAAASSSPRGIRRRSTQMALPPCHALFQFYVQDGELSCQLYQRSADLFLGVPFNIASYALLTMMVAQVCGLTTGRIRPHLRRPAPLPNHLEQAREQLTREPRPLPTMQLNPTVQHIHEFRFEDFTLTGYDPHPAIKAPIAV